MIKSFKILLRYLLYYFRAVTVYRIHSPFVFDFLKNTLEDKRYYYQFDEIEVVRDRLERSSEKIEVTDFGAGSQVLKTNTRSVSKIAKTALTPPSYARLLFKMVNHLNAKTVLEMGTCFGISSLYLSTSNRDTKVVTMEGCPNIAKVAQGSFNQLNASNITLVNAPFDESLPKVLDQFNQLDLIFIDGNHKSEPTLKYFRQALTKSHEKSCFIFHDIHWTGDMESAWETVKAHPDVSITIDLFFMGIAFFDPKLPKEHYTIIEAKFKPWMMGFFK